VNAYRDALQERTRERAPLSWARTQNNLGNALRILGQREPDDARLDEAVAAYREALLERTREKVTASRGPRRRTTSATRCAPWASATRARRGLNEQ
jgi:hypothetical protein